MHSFRWQRQDKESRQGCQVICLTARKPILCPISVLLCVVENCFSQAPAQTFLGGLAEGGAGKDEEAGGGEKLRDCSSLWPQMGFGQWVWLQLPQAAVPWFQLRLLGCRAVPVLRALLAHRLGQLPAAAHLWVVSFSMRLLSSFNTCVVSSLCEMPLTYSTC